MARDKTLKIAVIASDIPQNEIAKLARIHYTRLSQIVCGRRRPTKSERLRIAGVLQRPVDEIFPDTVTS